MKKFLLFVGSALLVALFVFVLMYAVRWFSNASTPITVHAIKDHPSRFCATMVTGDGVAMDCWKE